jgi:hypothetical protein
MTGVGVTLAIGFVVASAIYLTQPSTSIAGASSSEPSEAPAAVAPKPAAPVSKPAAGEPFAVAEPVPLPTREDGSPLRVLVLGDSVAGNMYQALRDFRTADLVPRSISYGGCGLFDAEKARAGNGWTMDSKKSCWGWRDKLGAIEADARPDVIVVHNKWDVEDQFYQGAWISPCQPTWTARYRAQLGLLVDTTAQFENPPLILMSNDRPRSWSPTVTPERLKCKTDVESELFAAHSRVRPLDLDEAVCPGGECATKTSTGAAIYRVDRVHFTAEAMQLMAPWIEANIAAAYPSRSPA